MLAVERHRDAGYPIIHIEGKGIVTVGAVDDQPADCAEADRESTVDCQEVLGNESRIRGKREIIVADISSELTGTAAECAETSGSRAVPLPGDLTSHSYCDSLPAMAAEATGRLDILVNNAGVMRRGNILAASDEDWALTMKINVEAVFRLCRATIRMMRESGGGAIVNVASCWGLYPGADHLVYCTSKAAVAAIAVIDVANRRFFIVQVLLFLDLL